MPHVSTGVPMRFVGAVLFIVTTGAPAILHGQSRDFQSERIVIEDAASDGVRNTMTLQTSSPLPLDVLLTIPYPSSGTADFLPAPSGSDRAWLPDGNAGTTAGTNFPGTTDAVA